MLIFSAGWITFAVSGIMQATLLVMCFAWKRRQHKLGIDDFGHPVHDGDERSYDEGNPPPNTLLGVESTGDHAEDSEHEEQTVGGEQTPLLSKSGDGDRKHSRWSVLGGLFGRRRS